MPNQIILHYEFSIRSEHFTWSLTDEYRGYGVYAIGTITLDVLESHSMIYDGGSQTVIDGYPSLISVVSSKTGQIIRFTPSDAYSIGTDHYLRVRYAGAHPLTGKLIELVVNQRSKKT